jgi:hypothetical protein
MPLITRIKLRRWSLVLGTIELSCFILLVACGSGCKSGSSMGSSWGSFGMGGPDPATLAEAPAFDGDTTKPSSTAQPYPTTSTPDSYALQPGQEAVLAAAVSPSQSPVTYGSSPPAAEPITPSSNTVAATSPQPQVGPYQAVPAAVSPAADSPALGSGVSGTLASQATSGLPAASSASRFSGPSASNAPPMANNAPSGRFSSLGDQRVAGLQSSAGAAGSRFSSPPSMNAPVSPAFPAATPAAQGGGSRYSNTAVSSFDQPATSFQDTDSTAQQSLSATTSAEESPTVMPTNGAPMHSPPVPPTSRRPDPGYRPGGTSSYQPASPIIVRAPDSDHQLNDLEGQLESGQSITPASFEAQLGSPQIPFQTNK